MAVNNSKFKFINFDFEAGLGVGFAEQELGCAIADLCSDFSPYLVVYGNVKAFRHAAGKVAFCGPVLGRVFGWHVKYCAQNWKS